MFRVMLARRLLIVNMTSSTAAATSGGKVISAAIKLLENAAQIEATSSADRLISA